MKSKLPVMIRAALLWSLQIRSLVRTVSFEETFRHNFWICASHRSLSWNWRPRYGVFWTCSRLMPLNSRDSVCSHYDDVIMNAIASQITSLMIVYSTVYSDADQVNIKAPRHWPLCGEFTGTGEFPAQRASYAENVSIWWRHHVLEQPDLSALSSYLHQFGLCNTDGQNVIIKQSSSTVNWWL